MSGNLIGAFRYLISPSLSHSLRNHFAFLAAGILKPQFTTRKISEAFSEIRAIHHIYWNVLILLTAYSIWALTLGRVYSSALLLFIPLALIASVWISYTAFYGLSIFILKSQASTRRHLASFAGISNMGLISALTLGFFALETEGSLQVLLLLGTLAAPAFLAGYALRNLLMTDSMRSRILHRSAAASFLLLLLAASFNILHPLMQSDDSSAELINLLLSKRSDVSFHCSGIISLENDVKGCVQFPSLSRKEQGSATRAYCEKYVGQGKMGTGPCPLKAETRACQSKQSGAEIYSYDKSDALKIHCRDLQLGTYVVLDQALESKN